MDFFLKFIVKWYGKSQKECFLEEPRHEDLNKGRYALRLMLDLAMNGKENFVPIHQCIRTTGNLREIFGANHYCPLSRAKLVKSARGARRL